MYIYIYIYIYIKHWTAYYCRGAERLRPEALLLAEVRICIYVYVYMYIYMYVYVCVYIYVYIYIYIHVKPWTAYYCRGAERLRPEALPLVEVGIYV